MAPSKYADLVQLTTQLNCSESTDEVKLSTIEKVLSKHKIKDDKKRSNYVQLGVLVICLIILAFMSGQVAILGKMYFRIFQDIRDFEYEKCALKVPRALQDAFLPPFNCSICSNLDTIPRRSNLCPEEFEAEYAYSGLPVIVSDGAANWTAMSNFDFEFFRELYTSAERDTPSTDCQFFPYKSGFRNLLEALNMSDERKKSPWYIGWSNCDPEIASRLRTFYQRPYFLPTSSESSRLDWIFMGTAGHGAHMHVDSVGYVSWQAQLRGRKKWTIEPPSECWLSCDKFEVTLEPGQIIVIDTDKWYHQTEILDGDTSVTIGSEYD